MNQHEIVGGFLQEESANNFAVLLPELKLPDPNCNDPHSTTGKTLIVIWGICGSSYNMPKSLFYLLKGGCTLNPKPSIVVSIFFFIIPIRTHYNL